MGRAEWPRLDTGPDENRFDRNSTVMKRLSGRATIPRCLTGRGQSAFPAIMSASHPGRLVMSESVQFPVTAQVDARGLRCPMPLLRARQGIRGLGTNDVLYVVATDPGSRRDIPAWLEQAGHRLLAMEEESGELHFWIAPGAGSDA